MSNRTGFLMQGDTAEEASANSGREWQVREENGRKPIGHAGVQSDHLNSYSHLLFSLECFGTINDDHVATAVIFASPKVGGMRPAPLLLGRRRRCDFVRTNWLQRLRRLKNRVHNLCGKRGKIVC
jgi:hypothetical protein